MALDYLIRVCEWVTRRAAPAWQWTLREDAQDGRRLIVVSYFDPWVDRLFQLQRAIDPKLLLVGRLRQDDADRMARWIGEYPLTQMRDYMQLVDTAIQRGLAPTPETLAVLARTLEQEAWDTLLGRIHWERERPSWPSRKWYDGHTWNGEYGPHGVKP